MHSVRVADRLADSQGEQSLVAGVGQRVDGLGEHAGWSSVDPRQKLEEEVEAIAEGKENKYLKNLQDNEKGLWHVKHHFNVGRLWLSWLTDVHYMLDIQDIKSQLITSQFDR